ncbi:MAG: branched-chain amino acid ABC transporter permease [Geminicoccaceae bacterium]|nr:branched-chain amino acid ABC transporter permease [Geminicoccaceae bacterium]MCS7268058.1 branched-chain amino acid ABC transporter permease [Geminicoccaceae bacterium]MCX7631411.1 branched-chain amino acid ABC transporter permease [Geminicoccaceae bacterium]MDW8124770.1 branched-chain amino acid ABC transporter permease [Geminicoccaceae bacterium]MDW8342348.1 branched-chain amino acid ABC transporter permease [Geminicoccaceae bacterium]
MELLLLLALLDGLAYAAQLFMVAVGLTLVFGVLKILNVAHGSLFAIGAYSASTLAALAGTPWLSLLALALAALAVGAIAGPSIERGLLARIYDKEQVLQLLLTFALFMILEDVQKLVWGVQPVFEDAPVRALGPVVVGGIVYTAYQLILLPGLAVVCLLFLVWFLRRTVTGRMILAVAHDREAAEAIGIDSRRIYLLAFTIGAGLAALGGALAAPTTSLVPGVGVQTIVLSFAVVATAGLGQIEGAAATALLVGLGRSFAVYFAPELEVVVPYLLMVIVLVLRPSGLFGGRELRRI